MRGVGQLRLVIALAAMAFGSALPFSPALAQAAQDRSARAEIARFQALDQKLQDIGWRLARANAPFCARTIASSGLQLQDMASFGAPSRARKALGLRGDFAVETVALDSPAAAAKLVPNREITKIAGVAINRWRAGRRHDWRRLGRAHDLIDAALARKGSVNITFGDGQRIALGSTAVCATRFELDGSGKRAQADGSRVQLGARFAGFSFAEDELAAAIAHELAHNLLAHRVWLDRFGRKRANIRLTEREADRLTPWLLANAGYDPHAATRFIARLKPNSGGGLLRSPTHDKWQARTAKIRAEARIVLGLQASGQGLNWSRRFDREIEPDRAPKKESSLRSPPRTSN